MNRSAKLLDVCEIGIKGGPVDGFEQKVKALQTKHKGNYAGDTLDGTIDNLLGAADQRNALLAFRAVLATGAQKLREPKDIKDTQRMIADIDNILGI
jgi:hypothetical protein